MCDLPIDEVREGSMLEFSDQAQGDRSDSTKSCGESTSDGYWLSVSRS